MNKFIVFAVFMLCHKICISQADYPYEEIKLARPADYKNAEPLALNAATFLLSTPYKAKDPGRERALTFLSRWGMGDRDYHLELTGIIRDFYDEKDLMSIFLPAMVKFCLENKALGSNTSVIEKAAVKTVLDYCNDSTKNFTLRKKFRKKLESH